MQLDGIGREIVEVLIWGEKHMATGSNPLPPMKTDSAPSVGAREIRTAEHERPDRAITSPVSISVVIPVYNEVRTIGKVVDRVLNCGLDVEVIAVDDASTDGTSGILHTIDDPRVRVVYHEQNQGKGAALRSGFRLATKPYVFVQDADLEYDPKDFAVMLAPLADGRADMVYGSRFLGGPHRVMFFWHYLGNRLLTLASNIINDLNLSDMETGQKAFVRAKLMALNLSANRFTFEPEITAKAGRAGWRIYEVPISYSGRTYEEGKKIGWRDGLAALWAMFYYRFIDRLNEKRAD
jgi:glycosyltransferase involved in cell wall biosynthesis